MPRRPAHSGFTLVEVLIGSTLAAIVLAGVLTSFVFLGRSLTRLANYQMLEARSREALTYLHDDFTVATAVSNGSTPTSTSLTLSLPAGTVTYTYDATAKSLRRQATFGASQDLTLLQNDHCNCIAFGFTYYSGTNGSVNSQINSSVNVPYSIKQVQVNFTLQNPATASTGAQARFDMVSPRFQLRNKPPPDGN